MTEKNHFSIFKILLIGAIAALVVAMSSSAWAKAELQKMRLGQTADKTRVVFDIKQNHEYKIFTLKNPARIVVDFYKADNSLTFSKMKFLDARLKQVRVKNQPHKNRVRVVLDLRKDFDYHHFALAKNKNGAERVVIDLVNELAKSPKQIVKKSSDSAAKKGVSKQTAAKPKPTKTVKVAKAEAKSAKPTQTTVKKPEAAKLARASQTSGAAKPKQDIADNAETQKIMDKSSDVFTPEHKELVVAIDAGHGGKDTGAIGHNRVYEKVVVLQLAKKLKKYIDAQPGMRAVLTRDRDVFIPLHKRVRIAHEKDADIFLSLHADAFPNPKARGGSVYILSTTGASSVMARILAKSENASLQDVKLKGRESDVAFVLSDLTREANIRASRKLGKAVLGEMARSVKLHKKHVQSADFAVLKSIDMPSLLIETAFISNPTEAKKLRSDRFQTQMAKSIVRGLDKFFKNNASQPRWGEKLYVHYRVQKGDTLSEIAANYNVSTYELKKLNRIKQADRLYVGKKLRIPVSDKVIAKL